jgi:hypothetical protein
MTTFSKLSDTLKKIQFKDLRELNLAGGKYISAEFQKYGYDLAVELDDLAHKSLYIKLAKTTPRAILESARSFVKDASHAKNKGKLFMWKLGQLRAKSGRKS